MIVRWWCDLRNCDLWDYDFCSHISIPSVTHSPMNKGFQNSILKCNSCNSSVTVHPECWPIPVCEWAFKLFHWFWILALQVPNRDPYFPRVNASTGEPFCLAFTRSLPGQLTFGESSGLEWKVFQFQVNKGFSTGQREQLNQVTAYLDASFVYGSDVCEARKLRSFVGGKLNTTAHPGGSRRYKDLLPETPFHPECKAPSGLCFEAGRTIRVYEIGGKSNVCNARS